MADVNREPCRERNWKQRTSIENVYTTSSWQAVRKKKVKAPHFFIGKPGNIRQTKDWI